MGAVHLCLYLYVCRRVLVLVGVRIGVLRGLGVGRLLVVLLVLVMVRVLLRLVRTGQRRSGTPSASASALCWWCVTACNGRSI